MDWIVVLSSAFMAVGIGWMAAAPWIVRRMAAAEGDRA